MTEYTAKKVILKSSKGEYLIPFTDSIDKDLSNLSDLGNTKTLENKITNCVIKSPNPFVTFSGSTITLHKGAEFLVSDGYNANGQVNNVYKKIESDVSMVIQPQFPQYIPLAYYADDNHISIAVTYVESDEKPPQTDCYWRSEKYNKTLRVLKNEIVAERIIVLGFVKHTGGNVERIDLFSGAVKLVDYRQFRGLEIKPHIIESYVNGQSGYNLYSNGYCEQWGVSTVNGVVEISLLKPYRDGNYHITNQTYGWPKGGGYANYVISVCEPTQPLDKFCVRSSAQLGCMWRTYGYCW